MVKLLLISLLLVVIVRLLYYWEYMNRKNSTVILPTESTIGITFRIPDTPKGNCLLHSIRFISLNNRNPYFTCKLKMDFRHTVRWWIPSFYVLVTTYYHEKFRVGYRSRPKGNGVIWFTGRIQITRVRTYNRIKHTKQ